jgi:hypothetical protein
VRTPRPRPPATRRPAPAPRATPWSLGTRGGTAGSMAPRARRRAPPSWAAADSICRTNCAGSIRNQSKDEQQSWQNQRKAGGKTWRRRAAADADAHRCEHENMRPPTESSSVLQTVHPPGGRRGGLSFRRTLTRCSGAKISHHTWPYLSLAAASSLWQTTRRRSRVRQSRVRAVRHM